MDSATLARVTEVTACRYFTAQNDNDPEPVRLTWYRYDDSVYCDGCKQTNNCFHSGRLRLSGLLTNSVVKDVKEYQRSGHAASAAGDE